VKASVFPVSNAGLALHKLGVPTQLVSKIGDDSFGQRVLENDTFCADDINYELAGNAHLFHFGYPPTMRCMYEEGGASWTFSANNPCRSFGSDGACRSSRSDLLG
jgi:hypothetical protein